VADKATFTNDAEPFMGALFGTAIRLSNNRADAEDLVQETYLKAYRAYDSFQQGTNLRAWLFRILTNTHINRFRTKSRRPQEAELDDVENLYLYKRVGDEGISPSAEDDLMQRLTDPTVTDAVAGLPEHYRLPVLLADVEGFAYKEIAEILEIPIGTVMSRLHRGRNALQKVLYELAVERGIVSAAAD
jgi:RNA polymerase sigma-70 factor (ECF subfamily)